MFSSDVDLIVLALSDTLFNYNMITRNVMERAMDEESYTIKLEACLSYFLSLVGLDIYVLQLLQLIRNFTCGN